MWSELLIQRSEVAAHIRSCSLWLSLFVKLTSLAQRQPGLMFLMFATYLETLLEAGWDKTGQWTSQSISVSKQAAFVRQFSKHRSPFDRFAALSQSYCDTWKIHLYYEHIIYCHWHIRNCLLATTQWATEQQCQDMLNRRCTILPEEVLSAFRMCLQSPVEFLYQVVAIE